MRQIYHIITSFSLIYTVAFFSGCSSKQVDYDFTFNPYEKEEKIFNQIKEQGTFAINDEYVFRIDQNRFFIYDDVESAPVDFGFISLESGKVHLKNVKENRVFSLKVGKDDSYVLRSKSRTIHLAPDYTEHFYQPKDIFEAIKWGKVEDVERLVAQGSAIEEINSEGSYPLIEAIYNDNYPIAEYLVRMGVDLLVQNYQGMTALHTALKLKNKKMVKLLLAHGTKEQLEPCDEFTEVLKENDFEFVKMMGDAGFNLSCKQSTLLFWMVAQKDIPQESQLDYLNYLLEKGIKTDAVLSKKGETILMQVAAFGKEKLLSRLIDYGVDLFVEDHEGRTALDYDSIYCDVKNTEIEKLLKEAGLNTGIKAHVDKEYKEAMRLFVQGENLEAYWRLVKLSDQYKLNYLYEARIHVAESLPKPSLGILKDLVTNYERITKNEDKAYYRTLISLHEKMKPLVVDDARKTANGDFKQDTLYDVLQKIDALYDKLLRYDYTVDLLYEKYLNLSQLNHYSTIVKRDLNNGRKTRYVGESLHGKPFGKGALKYADGSSYYGIVIHFKRHGKGKMNYKDGTMYDGMWENDQRDGKGFFTDAYSALYLGTFKDDKLVGEAKMVRPGKQ